MRADALGIFAIAVGLLVAGSVSAQSSDFVPNQKSPPTISGASPSKRMKETRKHNFDWVWLTSSGKESRRALMTR